MTVHEHPPGTARPAERQGDDGPFLIDGCARCEKYASELGIHFDAVRWRAFWSKMLDVEFHGTGGYASHLDQQLGRQLYYVALGLQRAFGLSVEALRFPDPSLVVYAPGDQSIEVSGAPDASERQT